MSHAIVFGPLQSDREAWANFRREFVTASRFADVMAPPKKISEAHVNRYAHHYDGPRWKTLKSGSRAGETAEVPNYAAKVQEAAEAKGVIFWGESAITYMWQLVSATITGKDKKGYTSASMDRGNEKEQDAGDTYRRARFVDLKPAQFVYIEGTKIGCTPDFRCEEGQDEDGDGLIQVKCPDQDNYLRLFMEWHEAQQALGKPPAGIAHVQEDYRWQIIGELWVMGYRWNDFMQFDDRFPHQANNFIVRVHAEEVQDDMEKLQNKVVAFADMVEQKVDNFRQIIRGATPAEVATIHSSLERLAEPSEINPFAYL